MTQRDWKTEAEELRLRTLLDGEYDASNAILSVHAGTGGVDAMDWAEMLLRMYTRWAEKKGYTVRMLDLQDYARNKELTQLKTFGRANKGQTQ